MEYRLTEKATLIKKTAMAEYSLLAKSNIKDGQKLINFASGYPAEEVLPVNLFRKYLADAMEEHGKDILQYGSRIGYGRLRMLLKENLKQEKILSEDDDIILTYGATEALSVAVNAFINPGDRVITENPTFSNFLQMIKMQGGIPVGIPMEGDGINLEKLEAEIKKGAKLIYTISNFNNPSGITMIFEKKKRVYELAVKYQIPILEDNPYGHLRYSGEDQSCIKTLDHEGAVLYVGSMSKLIAPGIRVGYMVGNRQLCKKLTNLKGYSSGSSTNITQYALALLLEHEDIKSITEHIRKKYKNKLEIMREEIKNNFHPAIKCVFPEGGMYLWVTLPKEENMKEFCRIAASELHVPVTPGFDFCSENSEDCTSFRLNFVRESKEDIIEGIGKLGKMSLDFLS